MGGSAKWIKKTGSSNGPACYVWLNYFLLWVYSHRGRGTVVKEGEKDCWALRSPFVACLRSASCEVQRLRAELKVWQSTEGALARSVC